MTDSWWLKVERAEKHMVEIESAASAYADRHAYEFVRVRHPKRDANVALKIGYRLHFIEEPDPRIAVALGDFVHNLRSALDHIIVASVPAGRRKSAGFPIITEDIWMRDADGEFVVNDAARRQAEVVTMLRGLAHEAQAIVIWEQPYHHGDNAFRSVIGMLSRLENADKHRRLVTIGGGVRHPIATWSMPGIDDTIDMPYSLGPTDYIKANTVVGWEWDELPAAQPGMNPAKMQMKIRGTAEILIQIRELRTNQPADFLLRDTMTDTFKEVRRILLRLEPFVRR